MKIKFKAKSISGEGKWDDMTLEADGVTEIELSDLTGYLDTLSRRERQEIIQHLDRSEIIEILGIIEIEAEEE